MPLTLELLRHGDALPAGPGGDVPRRLSPAGEQALRRLALRLAKDGWRPERVFASPLRRARDSAQLVLEPLTPPVQIEIMDELAHTSEPAGILAALAKRQAVEGCVLLVGHQPLIGLLAAHLEGRRERTIPAGTLLRIMCPDGAPAGRCQVILELSPGAG